MYAKILVGVFAQSNSYQLIIYEFVCMYKDLSDSEVLQHHLYERIGLLYSLDDKYRTFFYLSTHV